MESLGTEGRNIKLQMRLLWVLLNFRINMCMRGSGKMIREMGGECSSGKMARFMRGIGAIIWHMDMEG